jgi:hypothetical protein
MIRARPRCAWAAHKRAEVGKPGSAPNKESPKGKTMKKAKTSDRRGARESAPAGTGKSTRRLRAYGDTSHAGLSSVGFQTCLIVDPLNRPGVKRRSKQVWKSALQRSQRSDLPHSLSWSFVEFCQR